jgi:hypothetical protein
MYYVATWCVSNKQVDKQQERRDFAPRSQVHNLAIINVVNFPRRLKKGVADRADTLYYKIKTASPKKRNFNPPKILSNFFIFFTYVSSNFLVRTLQCKKNQKDLIFAHENMKKIPQKLLITHNQHFFSLPAWLPKRPILGRNKNFIGSPCLLSTISLQFSI